MDLEQISGYLAQKKIKSMYLGNNLIYQDSKGQTIVTITLDGIVRQIVYNYGLETLEMGTVTHNIYYPTIHKYIGTGDVHTLEMGTVTTTITIT